MSAPAPLKMAGGGAAEPRDNPLHRAFFSLPPVKLSDSTALAVPEMPAQKVVTGDTEVDAVLWLRELIGTGHPELIEKAKLAAKRIKTPLAQLEKRYSEFLRRSNPGNPFATFSAIGFDDLDRLASQAIEIAGRRHEASSRFGDALFESTPAEKFCNEVMNGVALSKDGWSLNAAEAAERFDDVHEYRPATLSDCLVELAYWRELNLLRDTVGGTGAGDPNLACSAREDYAFACLARIAPRNSDEAVSVLRYLLHGDGMDRGEHEAILFNLIGAPSGASKTK